VKRLREPVERYFAAGSPHDGRLDTARRVIDAIWDEHEATATGNLTAARSALATALALEPDNMYLRYLEHNQRAMAKEASARQ
jgi:spermidine synthase